MSIGSYLQTRPLSEIIKYRGGPTNNAIPFTGYPRQHPSEKNKLILIHNPLEPDPAILEFKLEDVLFVEEIHSAVTESGEGVPLVKLWVKKGAHGVVLEPFEVADPVRFINKSRDFQKRFRQDENAAGAENGG
jgi:hypothetical protein